MGKIIDKDGNDVTHLLLNHPTKHWEPYFSSEEQYRKWLREVSGNMVKSLHNHKKRMEETSGGK